MRDMHDCEYSLERPVLKKALSRRDFIRATAMGTAGAAFAGGFMGCAAASQSPRIGPGNIFMENDKPLLAAVEGTDLNAMLKAGIEALDGLDKLVKNKNVVIKPNILTAEPPPVTTDIEMVLAVAGHLREAGAKSITMCDANASGATTADKFKDLGFPPRLQEAGVALSAVDFSDRLSHVFVSKESWISHPTIGVVKTLQEADVIVNLPVVKRHSGARFTCALKNHFGSVYFPLRQVAHRRLREGGEGKDYFDRALSEYADAARSELTIADGRVLLTRDGPRIKGKSEVKSGINRLVFSGDMVATDVYCSNLMAEHDDSYSPDMISYQLEIAEKLGLGVRDLNDVAIKEITV